MPRQASEFKGYMLSAFDDTWAFAVTMGGQPQINKPGWEITRQWEDMYQAVAISSRYRFCGQGSSPRKALEEARDQMRQFHDELTEHLKHV